MSEISSHDRFPEDPEAQPSLPRINRRSFIRGAGLLAAGGIVGGYLTSELFHADRAQYLPDVLSDADYKRLEESGNDAKERAKELQARINATAHNNQPIDILVLDEIFLEERVGNPVWKIDRPILLGDPPKMSDVDKGFWFGIQFPNPGGVGRAPSVGIRAVLFDHSRMTLSYFVPAGQDALAAQQMQVLVMPPDPHMPPSNIMVAYGYNEFAPDQRQRRSDDPSKLVAPGLQIAVD